MGETAVQENPLAAERIGKLIAKFAIPAIMSMLVSSLYNIVDQIFIGQGVGMLGNAATNIAFPISIICTATALLLGIGSASNYNLESGAGNSKKASQIVGTGLAVLIISGITIGIIVLVFLDPLLHLFGVTPDVLPLAQDYTGITAFGIPFLILTTGGNHLIRADRSPTYSMACMLTGAIINTILDPLFIFGFQWGIKGAAGATVIGQVISGFLVIIYFCKFRNLELTSDAKGDRLSWPGRLYQPDRYGHRADHDEQYVETLWGVFRIWDGYTAGMRGRYLKSQYGVHGNLHRNITGVPANLGL